MLYATLKILHLLSIIVWVGGMAFTLFFLRPAVTMLEPPARIGLMHVVLRRFFGAVVASIVVALASGIWMMAIFSSQAAQSGASVNMPLGWTVMAALGVLMMAIFGHIRFVLFKRLQIAVTASNWPAGGAALAAIRTWVQINLLIGVVIVAVAAS